MPLPTLTELGLKHYTDKAYHHCFTQFYEPYIEPLRADPVKLFEIGVDTGASLFMWADYFNNGTIYAIDIEDKKFISEERIHVEQGSQSDPEFLNKVFSDIVFDIIIDDGSHKVDHQQISLKELFKRLRPGGFYILEDLHTSRAADPIPHPYPGNVTALQLLENIRDKKPNEGKFYIEESDIQTLRDQIEFIEIYKKANHSITSIIKKKN